MKKNKPKRSLPRKILNGFIGLFGFVVFLFILFLVFSQTDTFHRILRKKIIENYEENFNGALHIGEISGSLFTSFTTRNFSVSLDEDTLLFARKFSVRISPLLIFKRTIQINSLEIEDAKVKLLEKRKGVWNYSLLPKNKANLEKSEGANDSATSESGFPFLISIGNFAIKNLDFVLQDSLHNGSDSVYATMNYGDVRLKNLDLNATLFLDLRKNAYNLILNKFGSEVNTKKFALKKLTGFFYISPEKVLADNVKLETDSSTVMFNAELDSVNFFAPLKYTDFKNRRVRLRLKAEPFCFADLNSFLNSTDFLKGNPFIELDAGGKYGDLDVQKLRISFDSTEINGYGKIKNLERPENLWLNITLENTKINESDVHRLLSYLNIPDYHGFTLRDATIQFRGKPEKFAFGIKGKAEKGDLNLAGNLDFSSERLVYDVRFESQNLNLAKIIGTETVLNLSGRIKGRGVKPDELKAKLNLNAFASTFNGYSIDTLALNSSADKKKINLRLLANVDEAFAQVEGALDFTNKEVPRYNLLGTIDSLNLASFLENPYYDSKLNFGFAAKGESLQLDSMIADFEIRLSDSELRHRKINDSNLSLVLRQKKGEREIKLVSDFADFEMKGNFSLSRALDLLSYQQETISDMFAKKFSYLNPGYHAVDSKAPKVDSIVGKNLKIDFSFAVKDFEPVAILLNAKDFDIAAHGKGKIENTPETFSVNSVFTLDYFMNAAKHSLAYVSGTKADVHFSKSNLTQSLDDMFGSVNVEGKKIYVGEELRNISFDVVFNQHKFLFSGAVEVGKDAEIESDGELDMLTERPRLELTNLTLNYKGDSWRNDSNMVFLFPKDSMIIRNFALKFDNARFAIAGEMRRGHEQNLKFVLENLPSRLAGKYFFTSDYENLRGNINLSGTLDGTTFSPKGFASLRIDSVGYKSNYFGNVVSSFDFQDNMLALNLAFSDFRSENARKLLTVKGSVPLEISRGKETPNEERKTRLFIRSQNFNLASLNGLFPIVSHLKGKLSANVNISGVDSLIDYEGFLRLQDGRFRVKANNLDYAVSLDVTFRKQTAIANKFEVRNLGNVKHVGKLEGAGAVILNGLKVKKVLATLAGDLQLLSRKSQVTSPNFFGKLYVKTENKLRVSLNEDRLFIRGALDVPEADVTVITEGGSSVSSKGEIIYEIIGDTTKVNREEKKYRMYLSEIKKKNAKEKSTTFPFDYSLKINFPESAKMELILSKLFNQKLVLLAKGNLEYESIAGRKRTQGFLELQPGSKLEFVKTFNASGKVKFESDLSNPYLDIVATYIGNYNAGTAYKPDYIDVEVEMKLKGELNSLAKNLMKNPNSVSIYKGAENIRNRIRDNRYDISDAILFIYTGRFKSDLTAQDKSELAGIGNSATSFLGSAISTVLNAVVGDVVSDIKIDKHGEDTRLTISGRYQNIRYSVGGTTKIQNINEANIKIEYQLFPNFILRVERREPVVQNFGLEEKISELGLKYRWEF